MVKESETHLENLKGKGEGDAKGRRQDVSRKLEIRIMRHHTEGQNGTKIYHSPTRCQAHFF